MQDAVTCMLSHSRSSMFFWVTSKSRARTLRIGVSHMFAMSANQVDVNHAGLIV